VGTRPVSASQSPLTNDDRSRKGTHKSYLSIILQRNKEKKNSLTGVFSCSAEPACIWVKHDRHGLDMDHCRTSDACFSPARMGIEKK
jgi:hypothetical protein